MCHNLGRDISDNHINIDDMGTKPFLSANDGVSRLEENYEKVTRENVEKRRKDWKAKFELGEIPPSIQPSHLTNTFECYTPECSH